MSAPVTSRRRDRRLAWYRGEIVSVIVAPAAPVPPSPTSPAPLALVRADDWPEPRWVQARHLRPIRLEATLCARCGEDMLSTGGGLCVPCEATVRRQRAGEA